MTVERPNLHPRAAARLDDFERPHVLGASRQLELAADLLVCVIDEHEGPVADLVHRLRQVAAYLVALRGGSSQAFPNALAVMLDEIDERQHETLDRFQGIVIKQIQDSVEQARRHMTTIAEIGASLVANTQRIFTFDYSSSVAMILKALGGSRPIPAVVIPEARTLDGGRRYVEDLRDSALQLEFIPDAAIGSKVNGCDLAFIGAETVSAEGGCYNTTGSFLVALACQYWGVPLYTPTSLIKIDPLTALPDRRPIPDLDSARLKRLTAEWPDALAQRVTVSSPDLDYVPPELMTGFITELGILPPTAIAAHAERRAGSRKKG